jgi:excisionase family DNA binding protein
MTYAATLALPRDQDVQISRESQRALATYLETQKETQEIQILGADNTVHPILMPTSALRLLLTILTELSEGNAVSVVPIRAELATQEAADMLNVSPPYLAKLLEDKILPFHWTGKHRRIKFADLLAYKAKRDSESHTAMTELEKQAQDFDMGYK